MMAMKNPPHPGGIVKRQCLEPLGLSVTKAAESLGVARQTLSELINERTGVSIEMAVRLSKAFGSKAFGSTPETQDRQAIAKQEGEQMKPEIAPELQTTEWLNTGLKRCAARSCWSTISGRRAPA